MTENNFIPSHLDLINLDWDACTDYYKEKCRDLPEAVDPVSDLLQELDIATVEMLYLNGDSEKVWLAYYAVLNHPLSTWTEETLDYRQRQLHYK